MATSVRVVTFNVEDLNVPRPAGQPSLAERVAVTRPQLERLDADGLCLAVRRQGNSWRMFPAEVRSS
jgi:hypothetical protein